MSDKALAEEVLAATIAHRETFILSDLVDELYRKCGNRIDGTLPYYVASRYLQRQRKAGTIRFSNGIWRKIDV